MIIFPRCLADFSMQDGAPCHTEKDVKQWLPDCEGNFFDDWPGNSPNLNPIENLWALIKRELRGKITSSLSMLEATIRDVWQNFRPQFL